ncbi:hypothetical protein BDY21DRAFT_354231 [Lineolata rhizophorae]|uniref:Uncharacterized protein n=1 Tax=Lineolata rhizophorae TaxID=578093 RepID=A0A6A6NRV2_9PEZI|nr:hypothetical protein BDY21DRAFT_354231 [Lineolata rhizophorae]
MRAEFGYPRASLLGLPLSIRRKIYAMALVYKDEQADAIQMVDAHWFGSTGRQCTRGLLTNGSSLVSSAPPTPIGSLNSPLTALDLAIRRTEFNTVSATCTQIHDELNSRYPAWRHSLRYGMARLVQQDRPESNRFLSLRSVDPRRNDGRRRRRHPAQMDHL